MNLKKLLLTQNNCYKAGKKMKPTGIMVHSTGVNNTSLKRYIGPDDGLLGKNAAGNHWNQPKPDGRDVCVHGFIGKLADGTLATYQTLPWDIVGWHAGGKANNSYIGFEICEDGLTDAKYFAAVYQAAIDLCVYLCKEYGIKPEKPALICHSEGATLGLASSHSDVMHWFPKFGKSMDTFRADVKAALAAPAAPQKPAAAAVAAPKPAPAVPPKTAQELAAEKEKAAQIVFTVLNAINDGELSDKNYWIGVLSGEIKLNVTYMKTVMDNIHKKLNPTAALTATTNEIAVDNAIADGIVSDKAHWLGVLNGTVTPNPTFIGLLLDNAHKIVLSRGLNTKDLAAAGGTATKPANPAGAGGIDPEEAPVEETLAEETAPVEEDNLEETAPAEVEAPEEEADPKEEALADDENAPAPEEEAPAEEEDAPAPKAEAPAEEEAAPEEEALAEDEDAPAPEAEAPAEEEADPEEEAPAEDEDAPAPEAEVPAEEEADPEAEAPAEDEDAPAPEAEVPAEEEADPEEKAPEEEVVTIIIKDHKHRGHDHKNHGAHMKKEKTHTERHGEPDDHNWIDKLVHSMKPRKK